MKVGIIGGGGIARVHGPLIQRQRGAKIVGIADLDLARAEALSRELGEVAAYADPEEMIEKEKPDVVHVLVPPQHHASVSLMALSRGCHVLVEKPMALTLDEAQEMGTEAARRGLKICANHNMLFDPVIVRAREAITAGVIGRVTSVEASYVYDARRGTGWLEEGAEFCLWAYRLNGGPLQDLMPHPASLVLEYASPVKEIRVISADHKVLAGMWPDDVRVLIQAENATGLIHLSVAEAPDVAVLTVRGTKGMIQANTFNGILLVHRRGSFPRALERGLSGLTLSAQYLGGTLTNVWHVLTGRFDKSGGMGDLIGKFYEAIQTGGDPPISPDDCMRVVKMTQRVWPKPVVQPVRPRATVCTGSAGTQVDALVTGASGFIGTHLVRRLLDEGLAVRALVRHGSIHAGRTRMLDLEIFEGELSDSKAMHEAVKGVRMIFHAGATLSGPWDEHQRTNVEGTAHLLKAALDHGVERFVFLSSLAVLETSGPVGRPIDESSPHLQRPREMGGYAWSKIEAEKLLFTAHREQGLPATIVRPGVVIGPLGPVFFPHLGFRYRDQVIAVFGRARTRLPLTYVKNTVDGIYRAALSPAAIGNAFNLVDDGEVTVGDYLERFCTVTGLRIRMIPLPVFLPYLAASIYEVASSLRLVKPGATSRRQLYAKHHSLPYSNARARSELGWIPNVSLETGMDLTFEWYRKCYGIE